MVFGFGTHMLCFGGVRNVFSCQRLCLRDHDFCFSFPALSPGQLKSVQCRSQFVRGIMIHPLTPVGLTEDSPRSFHVFSIFKFYGGWQDSILLVPCLRPCCHSSKKQILVRQLESHTSQTHVSDDRFSLLIMSSIFAMFGFDHRF